MFLTSKLLIEQYERRIADMQSAHEEVKKLHAAELARVISELDKLQQEYARLLRVMHPAVQSIALPGEEKEEPKSDMPLFPGVSRFDRFRNQKIWEQEQAAKRANEHRELPIEEKLNGSL